MSVPEPTYDFRKEAARTFMSGQTQTVLLTGHTTDLFYLTSPFAGEQRPNGNYVGLLDYLRATWSRDSQTILLAYEVNGSIEIVNRDRDEPLLRDAWVKCRTLEILSDINAQAKASGGKQKPIDLDEACRRAEQQWVDFQLFVSGDATKALKFLRKLCRVSRESCEGDALFGKRIVILLEDVHLLIPDGEVSRLGPDDRARAILCRDWFTSTDFQRSFDAVVLIAESASQINGEVRTLPQLLQVDVPSPDLDARRHFIKWFNTTQPDRAKIKLWGSQTDLARQSAGLSLHALWQLLRGSVYDGVELNPASVTKRVEAYILSQLGEGTVEFHKPVHTLDAIVGNTKLVHYLRTRVMPRMRSTGRRSLRGVAVSGPIGAGKTFIFEGVAAELGMPVFVLKNLRSKWFGETDVILERLYRVLSSLSKVALFVDEADTMFGGVGADQHATERRLTGKI